MSYTNILADRSGIVLEKKFYSLKEKNVVTLHLVDDKSVVSVIKITFMCSSW